MLRCFFSGVCVVPGQGNIIDQREDIPDPQLSLARCPLCHLWSQRPSFSGSTTIVGPDRGSNAAFAIEGPFQGILQSKVWGGCCLYADRGLG